LEAFVSSQPSSTPLLDDLYRDILLDHYRNPRHRGHLEAPNHEADGANPLCGDQIHIEARVDGDRIEEVAFTGTGCSISQASASMMTDYVRGKTPDQALAAVGVFQQMMITGEQPPADMGDIEALAGVAKFPVRVKCASLAWKTLEQALMTPTDTVSAGPVTTDDGKE
jgi:nitrogen fixation NifU-like protein